MQIIENANVLSLSIDRAKGLAILLVILGHISSPLGGVIFSFHVPLFFLLAGIYINPEYTGFTYLRKNFDRLIIPFIIFGLLGFFVTYLKNQVLHRPQESIEESLVGILFWMDAPHMHHYGFVLWFLPALFWARLMAFGIIKYLGTYLILGFIVSIILAWVSIAYLNAPFGLDKGFLALPWVLMGYIFYRNFGNWFVSSWSRIGIIFIVLCLLVYFQGMTALDLAQKNAGNLFQVVPYTVMVSILLIGLIYKLSEYVYDGRRAGIDILAMFGRHSMLVLIFHVYTNNIFDIIIERVIGEGYWPIIFLLSATCMYVAIRIKQRFQNNMIFKYL